MTNRMGGYVEKVVTPFGPIHVCVYSDGAQAGYLRFARNDRLTDSGVDKLLTQIETTVNDMLDGMRP